MSLNEQVLRCAHAQRVARNLRVPRPVALHADDRLLDDVIDAAPADGPVETSIVANSAEDPVYVSGLTPQPAAEQRCRALGTECEPATAKLVGLTAAYDTPEAAPLLKTYV